jgi:hypothetical protein
MTSTQNTRLDQIAELTRGVEVPLPHLDVAILELVIEALALAWDHVRKLYPETVREGEEAEISALIDAWLNAQLPSIPGLDLVVASVDRGKESISFDGKRIEVRPDLSFRLTHQDARFRLVAECKIVDRPQGKTAALYRTKGIARFVDGDYAWACREAIMLGYVRCQSGLEQELLQSLKSHPKLGWVKDCVKDHACKLISKGTLGTSTHRRSFSYVHAGARVPGPIELWHLWLPAA